VTSGNMIDFVNEHIVYRVVWDMGTPGSPQTRLTTVPDKWVRPTKRPVDLSSGSNRPSWRPTRPLEDLPEDSPRDLIQNDLKTWRTRQDIGGFRLSRSIDMESVVI
jgi:hypothetical protein